MKLSPNFTLGGADRQRLCRQERSGQYASERSSDEPEAGWLRFLNLCERCLGKPISINSAYRSPGVNAAIGGSKTSQHCHGTAADIRVAGMIPDQVVKRIIASTLPYDQVIREFSDPVRGGGWTHVSIPNTQDAKPRKMALIIDKKGTRPYKSGG
jgi:hypothetical protein